MSRIQGLGIRSLTPGFGASAVASFHTFLSGIESMFTHNLYTRLFRHQVLFRPLTPVGLQYPIFWEGSKNVYNGGTVKTACTDHGDMGRFVARIIKDPRTLNQYVSARLSLLKRGNC